MNIAEFVQQPDLEKLVIIEVDASRELQGQVWIQCGGADTNVWYIALPNDGEVHKVGLDGSALTEKFSVALCHATADTFYYDDLAKVLYIHTTDSDDPATLDGDDPKYNIIAFWWEFFSDCPKQLEPYEDILKEANGGFEFWASVTDAEEWTEVVVGASTVTKETTEVFNNKSYASCKLTGDGANNDCYEQRSVYLKPKRKVKIKFPHKESAAAKTIRFVIRDQAANVYLNTSGEWVAGWQQHAIPNALVWTEWSVDFVTHAD